MLKTLTAILLMLVLFFPASQVSADMYKWVDENGVTHFSATPPESGQKAKTIKTPDYPATSPQSAQQAGPNEGKPKKKSPHSVEIFTTSWCKYCKRAIAFLRTNHIEFKQYDIEKDFRAAKRMRTLGGTGGVPFAIINGKKVPGFSPGAYIDALGLRKK